MQRFCLVNPTDSKKERKKTLVYCAFWKLCQVEKEWLRKHKDFRQMEPPYLFGLDSRFCFSAQIIVKYHTQWFFLFEIYIYLCGKNYISLIQNRNLPIVQEYFVHKVFLINNFAERLSTFVFLGGTMIFFMAIAFSEWFMAVNYFGGSSGLDLLQWTWVSKYHDKSKR